MIDFYFVPFGIVLQLIALVHFVRRRPDTFWVFVILIGGWLGALVYIAVEVLPDLGLLRELMQVWQHRGRLRELEDLVHENPAPGNHEELGDLYLERRNYRRARECYDRALRARTDSVDPFYRRGLCAIELGDYAAAVPDLERVVAKDPRYDFHRAAGLLANAYARTGHPAKAEPLFREAVANSSASETQYQFAEFLLSQGKHAEAREQLNALLGKKRTLLAFQAHAARPWFRRARALLKRLPA